MARDRLLVTAVVLISVGMAGIFTTAWLGGPHIFGDGPFPWSGMMRMMMGNGMMRQDQMKEMMQEMMSGRLPPVTKPEELPEPESPGAKLLSRHCSQCHHLPSPAMHSADEWPTIESRMFSRMQMMAGMKGVMESMMGGGMMTIQATTGKEQKELLAYLQRHALRPATVESLGPPGAPGVALFRRTCSQCHALPDSTLHTTDEWRGIVERMRKNMVTMGKPVITDHERDEIVGYLRQHAR